MIRSLVGWTALKKVHASRRECLKGDERILGDSDFVSTLLSKADERYTRHYELKMLGYDLDKMLTELARLFVMSPSAIGYLVRRGKSIAEENNYQLMG